MAIGTDRLTEQALLELSHRISDQDQRWNVSPGRLRRAEKPVYPGVVPAVTASSRQDGSGRPGGVPPLRSEAGRSLSRETGISR